MQPAQSQRRVFMILNVEIVSDSLIICDTRLVEFIYRHMPSRTTTNAPLHLYQLWSEHRPYLPRMSFVDLLSLIFGNEVHQLKLKDVYVWIHPAISQIPSREALRSILGTTPGDVSSAVTSVRTRVDPRSSAEFMSVILWHKMPRKYHIDVTRVSSYMMSELRMERTDVKNEIYLKCIVSAFKPRKFPFDPPADYLARLAKCIRNHFYLDPTPRRQWNQYLCTSLD